MNKASDEGSGLPQACHPQSLQCHPFQQLGPDFESQQEVLSVKVKISNQWGDECDPKVPERWPLASQ